jgi:hypothetical protein
MDIKTALELPSFINRALCSAGLAAALCVATLNYDAVEKAFRSGLDHVAEIRGVKIQGVEISFDSSELNRRAEIFPIEKFAGDKIARQIEQLDQRSLVRLLQVGTLSNLCIYSTPTAEMEAMVGIDHRLEDLRLVTRFFSDDARAFVAGRLMEIERKAHAPSTNGVPLKCYEMALTAEGLDVRTVIAHMLGTAFARNAAPNGAQAPIAPPAQNAPAAAPAPQRTPSAATARPRLASLRN